MSTSGKGCPKEGAELKETLQGHLVYLEEAEIRLVLRLLSHGREYYRLLAASARCSEANRANHLLTERLCAKLEAALIS